MPIEEQSNHNPSNQDQSYQNQVAGGTSGQKPVPGCYGSSAAGSGYATGRPRVHPLIVDRLILRLRISAPVAWALDLGCGAGLSTAALAPVAHRRLGLDPHWQMLTEHERVAPGASFLVATAEELPLAGASMDLVTAAGVVNYTDTARLLPEIRRVLRPDGRLAIYDFGHGRTSPTAVGLSEWFTTYRTKYPPVPGYEMDVRALDYPGAGLLMDSYEEFDVTVSMDKPSYIDYALTGSGVLRALAGGSATHLQDPHLQDPHLEDPQLRDVESSRTQIRTWCEATLEPIFAGQTIEVAFPAYLAMAKVAPL